jgi:hypothetical protein
MKQTMTADRLELISRDIFVSTDKLRKKKTAQLVGVKLSDDNSILCEEITDCGDVYQMLVESTFHPDKMKDYDLIAILTAGWAAPANGDENDEIAPSAHPERKRVKLALIAYSVNQTSSIMTMDGDPEYLYGSGENGGNGALQNAFEDFLHGIGW